jgi:hypothetical protein
MTYSYLLQVVFLFLLFVKSIKGQLISKRFFGWSIFSKKRTNEFVFTTMRRVFVRFFEEIDHPKKPFRNYLTNLKTILREGLSK